MKLEQIWHPYWLWEDQLMYTPFSSKKDMGRIHKAIDLLSDPKAFDRMARMMVKAFVHSCQHNLTNPSMNKIAYIGQATCFFAYGIREDETRFAWGYLTEEQRLTANAVAEQVLKDWENEQCAYYAEHGRFDSRAGTNLLGV